MKKILLLISLVFALACVFSLSIVAANWTDGVSVTLKSESGNFDTEIPAQDLFTYSQSGEKFNVTGIKYSNKNDIVKVVIPSNVANIWGNAFNGLASLKEVSVSDGADIIFSKGCFVNCAALENLSFGECTVNFQSNVLNNCPKVAVIDITKANATFENAAFKSAPVKELLMGSGKTYIFKADAFRNSCLAYVNLVDDSNVKIASKCFAETKTIEYIYVGKNTIANKRLEESTAQSAFDGNEILSKVILMDIEYIGKWMFSGKNPGTANFAPHRDLEVYSHSSKISFHSEAFNGRISPYKITFYSAATNISGTPSTSNFIIYSGIGHKYTYETIEDSTCTSQGYCEYVTDCICGNDYRENDYTSFSKVDPTVVNHTPFGKEITYLPKLSHTLTSNVPTNIVFANGLSFDGVYTYKCDDCGNTDIIADKESIKSELEFKTTISAIFQCIGYSTQIENPNSIAQGFLVNQASLTEYKAVTGNDVSYGVASAIKSVVNTSELVDANGNATSSSVICADLTNNDYSAFQIKITGIPAEHAETELFCLAYYIVNGTVYYVSAGAENDTLPTAISLSVLSK